MTFTDFLPMIVNGGFGLLFFIPPVFISRRAIKEEGVNFGTIGGSIVVFFIFGALGILFLCMGFGQTFNNLFG